ncbi:MAG: ATPase [Lacunisphaera sp.]|nr:ATPase [Lacunisphaera sp.]
MIAAVQFRNFKALRSAAVQLGPFNLFIGPNGSGKTSLIQALLRLRTLSGLPVVHAHELKGQKPEGPQIEFHFSPPFQDVRVTLGCSSDELVCNLLVVDHPAGIAGEGQWAELRTKLQGIRAFLFDHYAMAMPGKLTEGAELASNAGNLAAVLALRREQAPEAMARLVVEFCRITPEFGGLDFCEAGEGRVELIARLAEGNEVIAADSLAQGTLYLLAILTLAHAPSPPSIVCLEEADRGVHPRMLREVRDALYRLSYPQDVGESRPAVQVFTTTHSPYLLDQFKDHPEEVVLASKHGNTATFMRLAERADLSELMKEAHLGDLWYSGILGGVPGE